jgi:hypothetical protein
MGGIGSLLSHIPKGKLALVGLTAAGSIALLRKVAVGGNDGAYNAGGAGLSGANGYDGSRTGNLSDLGFTAAHPIQSLKNTAWAGIGAIPFLGDSGMVKNARLKATANTSQDIGQTISKGGYDKSFTSPFIGDVIGGTLSPEEKAMIALMDPKDRARYLLQKKMQEKAEMAALLSQLQGLRHQAAMQTINNIR